MSDEIQEASAPDSPEGDSAHPQLRAQLTPLRDEKSLSAFVLRERDALLQEAEATLGAQGGGRAWMHRYSDLIDAVVRRLWMLARERTPHAPQGGVTVLATGGYGQRHLAPHSDLDITILTARDEDAPVLHELFRLVMDVLMSGAKLKVGYGYRTLADFGVVEGDSPDASGQRTLTLDHQTQTALLDARLIAGDPDLFARFDRHFHERLQIADFLFRKEAERRRRREKFGYTPLTVEPNLKEGTGGLRDLQTASWMARVRFGRKGSDSSLWRELARRKVITPEEQKALVEDRDFILTVRCRMHLITGDRRDALTRTRQEAVAAALESDLSEAPPPVERFMRRLYATLGSIQQTSEKIVARCLDAPIPLGFGDTGLSAARRAVSLTEPDKVLADPIWPLHALSFCQSYGLTLAVATEEAIQRWCETVQTEGLSEEVQSALGKAFLELLAQPGDLIATLRRMQKVNLLEVVLPELAGCMPLIPYDPAHDKTVGEHTLCVLENLLHLRPRDTGPSGYGYSPTPVLEEIDETNAPYTALLTTLENPATLYLGALLHDIGKQFSTLLDGTRARHEATGAERTPAICARLGCSAKMTEQVTFLVRQHLLMAELSRLRDLSLPETIADFTAVVTDGESLRMLYLLTWADTLAVGPGIWTPMKARQLSELYERAEAALATREEVSDIDEASRLKAVRERLRRQLTRKTEGVTDPEAFTRAIHAHTEALPAAYLLNTPLPIMSEHLAMLARLEAQEAEPGNVRRPVIDVRTPTPDAVYTDLTVVARDDPHPGLLAKMTGVLFGFDINLHSVQAFTRPPLAEDGPDARSIVIDTLAIDFRDRPLSPLKRADVEEALGQVLAGEITLNAFLEKRGRAKAASEPLRSTVRLLLADERRLNAEDEETARGYTLIDIEAPDQTGVVYRLASIFSGFGWNILSARVSVWAGSVRCAFYLTNVTGGPLPAREVKAQLRPALTRLSED